MRAFSIAWLVLFAITACSKPAGPRPSLTAKERAKVLAELVESRKQCDVFRERLAGPNPDSRSVDTIYHDALKAKCLAKDA